MDLAAAGVDEDVDVYDSIVIGAGQAGLAASYHLRRLGVDHLVLDADREQGDLLVVRAGDRTWHTRTLVNATGTWTRPFVPFYPGIDTFRGEAAPHRRLPGP